MSWQSEIQSALLANAGIAALVGTRIYADIADGTTAAPYIVWQVIATRGETTHDGARGIEFPLIQVSCWAATKAQAIALASAVDDALNGNTISGAHGVTFTFSDQSGTYESDTKLFGEILEFNAATTTN